MKKKTKIMELKLVRFAKKKGYTIGRLYCLGEREEDRADALNILFVNICVVQL